MSAPISPPTSERSHKPWWPSWLDPNLVLILAIPAILMAANREWMFPYGNPTDDWLNYNYFFDYGQPLSHIYDSYKSTRLSWIWRGAALFHLFPAIVAYYLLQISTFYTCVVGFYYAAKHTLTEDAAVFGTMAFETYSQFHSVKSFEWDYQTHDSAATILLAILCLTLATKSRHWRTLLVLAGAAAASAFQSPYNFAYAPSIVIWYLVLNQGRARNSLLASAGLFALGGFGATLVYCIGNFAFGGHFLFFVPTIQFALFYEQQAAFAPIYWEPLSAALRSAKGLVVPLYLLALSLLTIILRLRWRGDDKHTRGIILCCAAYLVAFLPHLLFQLRGHPFLSDDHFIVALAPLAFLAGTATFAYLLEKCTWGEELWVVKLSAAAILCGGLLFLDLQNNSLLIWW